MNLLNIPQINEGIPKGVDMEHVGLVNTSTLTDHAQKSPQALPPKTD